MTSTAVQALDLVFCLACQGGKRQAVARRPVAANRTTYIADPIMPTPQANHAYSLFSCGKFTLSFFDSAGSSNASASGLSFSGTLMRRWSAFFSRWFMHDATSAAA